MNKLILTSQTKRKIMRNVWLTWAYRKAAPLALLLLVAIVESAFVSFGAVASNTLGAARNLQALGTYLSSAVLNAELYALAGAAVILVGGILFVRSTIRDLTALNRERIFIR